MKNIFQKTNSLFLVCIIIITLNGCSHFSISEQDATETAERFFSLATMKNTNDKIKEIYPEFNKIGDRIFFKNKCSISNISETSDGDFEVYADYPSNDNNSIPILLVIGLENGKTIIKSSRGISFSYYDKTYDYAKKKGCIKGNENDIELGEIIKNKGLYSELEDKTDFLGNNLYMKLKINSNNLTYENGLVAGNVTIYNNSDIDLSYSDIECKTNLLDEHGNVLKSIDLNAYEGIKANNMTNIRVYSTFNGEVFMSNDKIIFKNSISLRNKLKESIIKNTDIGCN